MTADELEEIVRKAVRDEFNRAGLRIDDSSHQDEAKEDFRFVRKLRKTVEGGASKVGLTVLMAIISGFIWLIWQGAQTLWGTK